jgi:16S rRNA (guanine966-N2)-methyltransferase
MARGKRTSRNPTPRAKAADMDPCLRVIGGSFGGRKLACSGDPRTRPMKDRVREAIFNLVGPAIAGKHAIDLFAGTGSLGLEALSRGASRATFVERHFPTVRLIEENVASLDVVGRSEVVGADTFLWARNHPTESEAAWAVFCSPPYDFYVDRATEMLTLIASLIDRAPKESVVVVEADDRFDFATLPRPDDWDVRRYAPAVVGVLWP